MILTFEANPVALSLGPLQIHWYAIMYIMGFLAAYFSLRTSHNTLKLSKGAIQDWLNISIFSVLIGGRLGYVFFYHWDYYKEHVVNIFYIWEGGMAFHGALIGLFISSYLFLKYHKAAIWRGFDLLSLAATPGLFFGRIGNFINSELVGRPTQGNWGVVFSQVDGVARHPSQLYEACFEGLLLGLFLYLIYTVIKPKPGILASLFLICYANSRFFIEFFREPDPQLGLLMFQFSLGQYLSLVMFATGLFCLFYFTYQPKKRGPSL